MKIRNEKTEKYNFIYLFNTNHNISIIDILTIFYKYFYKIKILL